MRNLIQMIAIIALTATTACKSSSKKAAATPAPTSTVNPYLPSSTLGNVLGYTISISGMEGGLSGVPVDVTLSSSALSQLYVYVTPVSGAQPATSVTVSDSSFTVSGSASPFQLTSSGLSTRMASGQAVPLNVTAVGGAIQSTASFNLKSDNATNVLNNNSTLNNTNDPAQQSVLTRLWNGATSLVSGGVSGIWNWITGIFQQN